MLKMMMRAAVLGSFVFWTVPAVAVFELTHTLNNPMPGIAAEFGRAVAVSGNTALVGAYRDHTGARYAGLAYIFDATTGGLQHTLNNPTPEAQDFFGRSVSVAGNFALVGAIGDDTGARDAGSAYLFDVTTGVLLHTLNNPTPEEEGRFGVSVSVSGNTALVGAFGDDTGADGSGSAYLFDVTTGALLHTLNNPTPGSFDYFGTSVSLSGNIALVSAYNDDTGALNAGSVYLFDVNTGSLLRTISNPAPAKNDYFGTSVSLSGNTALVGAAGDDWGAVNAGSAYLFDVTTGALLQTLNNPAPESDDRFGSSVSVSEAGNAALVGAFADDRGAMDAGSAYLFDITTGSLLQTLNHPTPAPIDYFGVSVSLSGNTALVGANNDDTGAFNTGSAYVFSAVPVPPALAFLLPGVIGLGLLRQRRQASP